jgi:hypothetical protein
MLVGETRALQQQAVLVTCRVRAIVGEKVETELHRPGAGAPLPVIELFRIILYRGALAGGSLRRRRRLGQPLLLEPQFQQAQLFRRQRRQSF